MNDWRRRARGLADTLTATGALSDPAWRAAFKAIPRHQFTPWFYVDGRILDAATHPGEWLGAIYHDTPLVTQMTDVPGAPGLTWATSSSTQPGLMARMLQLLDVRDRNRVLEIGTGTGYNAALLCHRLHSQNVASVDIDPDLVNVARQRLATLGYRPHLAATDGAAGFPERAPYDRIIATCAVQRIPPAWLDQLTGGGVIVADVRGDIAGSLAVLTKTDDTTVSGRFQSEAGYFMPLRRDAGNPLRHGGTYRSTWNLDGGQQRRTHIDLEHLHQAGPRLLVQVLVPDAQMFYPLTDADNSGAWRIEAADGSWAEATGTDQRVTEGGPRRLWRRVEQAVDVWNRHGQPDLRRFGITADNQGRQRIWLDEPANDFTDLT